MTDIYSDQEKRVWQQNAHNKRRCLFDGKEIDNCCDCGKYYMNGGDCKCKYMWAYTHIPAECTLPRVKQD